VYWTNVLGYPKINKMVVFQFWNIIKDIWNMMRHLWNMLHLICSIHIWHICITFHHVLNFWV
jgi:hypothetical protein